MLIFLFLVLFLLPAHAEFEIHYLDVGQGDSAIILCDGESMIIDGGPVSASSLLYSYIRNTLQLAEVNIVVATHPHDDHIGGIPAILNAAPVGVILSPVAAWDSSTFSSVIKYANLQGCPITVPSVGDVYTIGSADVTIISCWPEAWTVNDMSIILRVDYGDTSFLFTGDAEVMAEYVSIDSGLLLKADVLKVGHHGSHSSSCLEFLKAVSPKAAVISCGADNTYGHPHMETLNNLNSVKAEVLRTDIYGTIICRSDGRIKQLRLYK